MVKARLSIPQCKQTWTPSSLSAKARLHPAWVSWTPNTERKLWSRPSCLHSPSPWKDTRAFSVFLLHTAWISDDNLTRQDEAGRGLTTEAQAVLTESTPTWRPHCKHQIKGSRYLTIASQEHLLTLSDFNLREAKATHAMTDLALALCQARSLSNFVKAEHLFH